MREFIRHHRLLCFLLLSSLMALAFQGSRGLIEPDEGRYTNVALQILQHNEWISLYRNQDSLHFTKPPLTYWLIAGSVTVFGHNEWAVRLPMALAFVLCVFLAYQLGRLFTPKNPWLPAWLTLASPLLYLAAYWVSTDGVLMAMTTLAVYGYARFRFGHGEARWLDAMWLAFGLAFLSKGPPALLPLLAIVISAIWHKHLRLLWRPLGMLGFVLVGLSWYGLVIQRHPGLLDYFIGHEVVNRIASPSLDRNSQWYGPFTQYLPALALGALPALLVWWWYRKESSAPSGVGEQTRFLWLWLAVPLVVFSLSQSRLPLYVLGLVLPLILLIAQRLQSVDFSARSVVVLAIWLCLLVGFRAILPGQSEKHYKDSRAFARAIGPMLPGKPNQIIFVEDMARNGLNLYFQADIKKVAFTAKPKPISDSAFDGTLAQAFSEPGNRRLFILTEANQARFLQSAQQAGVRPILLGKRLDQKQQHARDRLIYTLENEFPR
jgi:4-amino-4-deoxy-L-arabinose transferase-like glycosyltransferase